MGTKTEIIKLVEQLPAELHNEALKELKKIANQQKKKIEQPCNPEKIKIKDVEITTWDMKGQFDNINIRDYAHDDEDE